ncbi:MAG: GLPGLI family protein [Flavobacterium sp.]|nr:GLPGLI family protein [Flavobacterium sp.]
MLRIFLLLFLHISFSQSSTIQVTYKVAIENEEDMFKDHAQLRSYFEYSLKNSWKIKFILKVDQNGSYFFSTTDNQFDKNNPNDRIMLGFTGSTGSIFCINDSIYTNVTYLGKNIFERRAKKENWIIHQDTKNIDGYLCYKATNINKVESGDKVFNHPVVAWFCPELPYQHGPNGYGNLPGLILELQIRNVVFGADKIEFTNIEPIDFSFYRKAKVYTPEEILKFSSDFIPD